MARTEEEIVGGYITVPWGPGDTRQLPTLKIRDSRTWKAEMAKRFGPKFSLASAKPGQGEMDRLSVLDKMGTEALIDLVVAYDKSGVLGGREGVEAHLDDYQLLDLYNVIVEATYRFGMGLLVTLTGAAAQAGPSGGASSLSLPPPSGASGPTGLPPN